MPHTLAAELLILQKVGGGYRFLYRLLQDYLATLYTENPTPLTLSRNTIL